MEARRGEIRAAELDAQHESPARSAAQGDVLGLLVGSNGWPSAAILRATRCRTISNNFVIAQPNAMV
jgi:hypothetical protein